MENPLESKIVYDLNDPGFTGEWALEQFLDLSKNFAQKIGYTFFNDKGNFTFRLSGKSKKVFSSTIEIRGYNLRGSNPVKLGQVVVLATSLPCIKVVYDSESISSEQLSDALKEAYEAIKGMQSQNSSPVNSEQINITIDSIYGKK